MKAALLFFLALASPLSAQTLDTRRHIEVSGTAKVHAEVDRAVWHVKIRGEAPTLAEASRKLETATLAFRDRYQDAKLPLEATRISNITAGRHFEGPWNDQKFKGFQAERTVVIELEDVSLRYLLEPVLLADDQIEIVKLELRTSRHEEVKKEALLSAIAAAKDKAGFLAAETGAELGVILAIREGEMNPGLLTVTENRIQAPDAGESGSEFQKLTFTATVTVKYELK